MTVVATNASDTYDPNGVTTVFPVTFQTDSASGIEVLLDDAVVDDALYTFNRDTDGTGDVTFLVAPAGDELVLRSNPSFQQSTEFTRYAPYFPDFMNKPLDRAAIRDIHLRDRIGTLEARVDLIPQVEVGEAVAQAQAAATSAEADALATASALAIATALAETLAGPLNLITTPAAPGTYPLPVGFNDQIGGTTVTFNGVRWSFTSSRWSALDFRETETYTTYYLDYARPNDSGDGLSEGAAKKNWSALTALVAGLADDSYVELVLMNRYVGVNSYTGTAVDWADGKNVVVRSGHEFGLTDFVNMREDRDQAYFAFEAHGSNGAWKCPIAKANTPSGAWVAGFYTGELDDNGFPQPIVSTGQSAASVETDELTQFADATWFYIHLPGGVEPDPATNPTTGDGNWVWCDNTAGNALQIRAATGVLLMDGIGGFVGAAGVSSSPFFLLPASDASPNTTNYFGMKNGYLYGSTGQGQFASQGGRVVVMENMRAAYGIYDLFNYKHRVGGTGSDGTLITIYEGADCFGDEAGYTGFNWGLTLSNSNNLSTGHTGVSVVRVGTRGVSIQDAAIADVDGCDSVNFGVVVPANARGASSFYPAAYVYDANTGQGLRRRMVLIGCQGANGPGDYSLLETGTATDNRIEIAHWRGAPNARVSGKVISYLDGTVLNT